MDFKGTYFTRSEAVSKSNITSWNIVITLPIFPSSDPAEGFLQNYPINYQGSELYRI